MVPPTQGISDAWTPPAETLYTTARTHCLSVSVLNRTESNRGVHACTSGRSVNKPGECDAWSGRVLPPAAETIGSCAFSAWAGGCRVVFATVDDAMTSRPRSHR